MMANSPAENRPLRIMRKTMIAMDQIGLLI
jgi:hypothetical protein